MKKEEGRRVVYEDHEDFTTIEITISDTTRWSINYDGIFKHTPTGKHYSTYWSVGATESQDEGAFEYEDEVTLTEVEAREVLVTQWVEVT